MYAPRQIKLEMAACHRLRWGEQSLHYPTLYNPVYFLTYHKTVFSSKHAYSFLLPFCHCLSYLEAVHQMICLSSSQQMIQNKSVNNAAQTFVLVILHLKIFQLWLRWCVFIEDSVCQLLMRDTDNLNDNMLFHSETDNG